MKCRINIILVAILLSKAIFGSILEVKIQDKQIAFIPDFEDHLKIVGYIADISTDGIFINVRQQKECLSKYVYVDNNNQIYLVRNYQYKAQGKLLNVFLQDKNLKIAYPINYPIVLKNGIYEFLPNKLISLADNKCVAFPPKKSFLHIMNSANVIDLNQTFLNTSQQLLPNQLSINASLTGINAYNPKITLYTIILNNIEFNLETALFVAGFGELRDLQIFQCFTRSSDPFIAILCLVHKLSKLNLSGSVGIPEDFLKNIVLMLKVKNLKFVPHDEIEFLQYVKQNNDFKLFETIVFKLGTDSAKEFFIDTMIHESNFDLDYLEMVIVKAIEIGSDLLINKAVNAFFQAVWQYHYPTTPIVNKIINLFNIYRDHLQNVENLRYYLSYCYYEMPIVDKELTKKLLEFMAASNWDIIGNASYLLYMIDNNSNEKESALRNLINACNKKNILALSSFVQQIKDDNIFDQPDNKEKDLMCQKIKNTLCTESAISTFLFHDRNDLVEYIQEYSQLIDNYFLLRNLI